MQTQSVDTILKSDFLEWAEKRTFPWLLRNNLDGKGKLEPPSVASPNAHSSGLYDVFSFKWAPSCIPIRKSFYKSYRYSKNLVDKFMRIRPLSGV